MSNRLYQEKEAVLREVWNEPDGDIQLAITLNPEQFYIVKAMEIYAKQEAIGFAEWVKKTPLTEADILAGANAKSYYEIEELYQLYLKSK